MNPAVLVTLLNWISQLPQFISAAQSVKDAFMGARDIAQTAVSTGKRITPAQWDDINGRLDLLSAEIQAAKP